MAKIVDEAQAAIDAHNKHVAGLAKMVTGDGKAITTMIGAIKRTGVKYHEQICLCAASCVVHVVLHGQTSNANQLIEAIGDGMRRNALRSWFLAFGPYVYEARDEAKGRQLYLNKDAVKAFKDEYNADNLKFASKLMATPFYEFVPEPEFKGFDFPAALAALVKRAHKIAKDHKDEDNVVLTGLGDAEDLLDTITSENVEQDKAAA